MRPTAKEISQPNMIPTMPPIRLSSEDSVMNWIRISRRRAPSALRRPISRVRSVTETSMMFMMPMPPTSSEIAGDAAQEDGQDAGDALDGVENAFLREDREIILANAGAMSRAEDLRNLFRGVGNGLEIHRLDEDDVDGACALAARSGEPAAVVSGTRTWLSAEPNDDPPWGARTPMTRNG